MTDDGSVDETSVDRARTFAGLAYRFRSSSRPIHTRRSSCHAVVTKASPRARRPYLLFLDGDCILPPDHVRIHLERRRPNTVMAGACLRLEKEASEHRHRRNRSRTGEFMRARLDEGKALARQAAASGMVLRDHQPPDEAPAVREQHRHLADRLRARERLRRAIRGLGLRGRRPASASSARRRPHPLDPRPHVHVPPVAPERVDEPHALAAGTERRLPPARRTPHPVPQGAREAGDRRRPGARRQRRRTTRARLSELLPPEVTPSGNGHGSQKWRSSSCPGTAASATKADAAASRRSSTNAGKRGKLAREADLVLSDLPARQASPKASSSRSSDSTGSCASSCERSLTRCPPSTGCGGSARWTFARWEDLACGPAARRRCGSPSWATRATSANSGDHGPLIDDHDLVVRMNNFRVTRIRGPSVGSRVDVFLSNFYVPGHRFHEPRHHAALGGSSHRRPNTFRKPKQHNLDLRYGEHLTDGLRPASAPERAYVPSSGLHRSRWRRRLRRHARRPASWVILLAADVLLDRMPRRLYVTGFSFFEGKSHYFRDDQTRHASRHHNLASEKDRASPSAWRPSSRETRSRHLRRDRRAGTSASEPRELQPPL